MGRYVTARDVQAISTAPPLLYNSASILISDSWREEGGGGGGGVGGGGGTQLRLQCFEFFSAAPHQYLIVLDCSALPILFYILKATTFNVNGTHVGGDGILGELSVPWNTQFLALALPLSSYFGGHTRA